MNASSDRIDRSKTQSWKSHQSTFLWPRPAALSFLFGIDDDTDTMNVLQGPTQAQLFDAALWPAALANLTGPGQIAVFRDVSVLENAFFGVAPYTLDTLLVISLEKNQAFLDAFADPKIPKHVPDDFPNKIPVSMDPFVANLLCLQSHWQVQRHLPALRAAIAP